MALRRFLYRDDEIVDDYLGQLGLGIPGDEIHTHTVESSGKLGLGIPGLDLGAGRTKALEVERNVRANGALRFTRLYEALRAAEPREIWHLDALDEATWDCLSVGDLIEVEVDIAVPTMVRTLDAAAAIGPLLGLASALGLADPTQAQQMEAFQEFSVTGTGTALTLVGEATSEPRYKFGLKFKKSGLQSSLSEIEGRSIVLGQIREVLEAGRSVVLHDIPAFEAMSRVDRRKVARRSRADRSLIIEIKGPAAILDVVAVYRGGSVPSTRRS